MYYEFESRYNMATLIFDDERLMIGDKCYPYQDIESLEITSAPLFSNYGIMTAVVNGKEFPVLFPRTYGAKLKRAIREMEQVKAHAQKKEQAHPAVYTDPYEEVKKLKELLDLDIITAGEFEKKKKELLNL